MILKSCIGQQAPLKEQQVTASQKRQAHQSGRQEKSPSQTSPWALSAHQVLVITPCIILNFLSAFLFTSS